MLVGTIPSSIIANCIKNFRLFIFDTQISAERPDRYSLISYISHYFNGQLTDPKHCCFDSGLYFDQSSSNYLLTSKGQECSDALLKADGISQGFYESASFFKSSASHTFCEKLQSPFLFSLPNLLLPKVKSYIFYLYVHLSTYLSFSLSTCLFLSLCRSIYPSVFYALLDEIMIDGLICYKLEDYILSKYHF